MYFKFSIQNFFFKYFNSALFWKNFQVGKVFTEEELKKIADLCIRNNTICIADEVYEHITYERPHFRIGTKFAINFKTIVHRLSVNYSNQNS